MRTLTRPVFLFIIIFLASAWIVPGQESGCTLKLAQLPAAPELKGFHLGMTREQVKMRVPQIVFGSRDAFGSSKTTINPDFNPKIDKSAFEGVRTVSLDFLDGRLVNLWIGYDSSFKWKTLDEFTEGMSQALNVPNAWRAKPRGGRVLSCADFQLTAMLVAGTPSLRISDTAAQEMLTQRQEAAQSQETENEGADPQVPPIIGDSSNKTYRRPDCPGYNDVPEKHRVMFRTTEDAEKAGYKPAKNCS